MARARTARRYAQAVFAVALERNELEGWLADLRLLTQVFSDPGLVSFIENPRYDLQHKRDLLKKELATAVGPLALNLVYILVDEGLVAQMGALTTEFAAAMNRHKGIALAEVTTAIPLDEGAKMGLAAQISRRVGKQVVLQTYVNSDILGGVVAKIDDRLIDGSVRTRLVALRRRLAGVS